MKIDEEKLYQAYYEPDRLWNGGKAIKALHKITSMLKKDIKSWLAKQALWQVHIPPPNETHHPHYDVTRLNEQHQSDLLYIPHSFFERSTYKYILTGIDIKSPGTLGLKNQARLHIPRPSSVIMDQSLKTK